MKVLVVFTFIILSALTPYARTITGIVCSDSTLTAVADAVCKLYEGDVQISNTTTNENGLFQIRTENKSALILEIDKEGFSGTVIIIDAGGKNTDLGRIELSYASELAEVHVEGSRTLESKGRTIIFPSSADLKASSSSLSLLQKLPLVGLETDLLSRKIKVDGSQPVIIIDGIPSTMDQFNAINPEDITKIEYSYITPQRYVDKGYKVMISVTLKKRQDGGQVYLWARSAVNATFVDGLIQTSYHKGASQFSVIYNPSWRNDQDAYDNIYGTYTGHDYELKIEQHDRSPFNYHTHALRLDYSFVPGDRTLFSVRFAAVPTLSKMRLTGDVQNSQLGNYTINNSTSSKDFTPSLDLFVRHEFNEKNSIEAQVVGTVSSSDYRRNNNYLFDDGHNDSYVNNIDNHRRSLISEISYVHNFDQTMRLSGGVQNTLSHNRNVYLNSVNNYNPVLTENNNYIYASFAKQFTKVYLSASTGLKMFWTRNDQLHRHFIHNMSSVNLAWYISQSWFLQADFGYTPYIPTLSSLTDYMQQTEPYMFQNGNPNLKVQENLTYALTANFKHKKFSATLKTGYYDFKNSTTYDITYLGNGKFLSHSVNSDKDNLWMGLLQMGINDVHGFGAQVMLRLRLFDCHIADWSRSLTSFDATLNLWWNKGPWTISYYRKFPGKSLNGYQVNKAENMDMLQLEYRPDRHWSFGIAWWYMFDKKGGRYPYWNYSPVANLYIDRYIKDSSNMVTLSACYTADFGALFKRNTNRSLNNTDSNNSLLKN